jgi:hypothetical protein
MVESFFECDFWAFDSACNVELVWVKCTNGLWRLSISIILMSCD